MGICRAQTGDKLKHQPPLTRAAAHAPARQARDCAVTKKIAEQLRLADDRRAQEYAINLSAGHLAALALSMADAWQSRDWSSLNACARHVLAIDSMSRTEIVSALIEKRLPRL